MLTVHALATDQSKPKELSPAVLRAVIETLAGLLVSPTQVPTPSDRI